MKKYISLILTIFIVLTSVLTVSVSSSPNVGGGAGGGGSSIGGVVVYPTISSGFVCQNQYSSINFDTGEISLKNTPVEFYDDVILKENEVLCPVKPFLETLQFAVSYNSFDSTITATLNDITMIIPLERNTITVNSVNYYAEYPAQNIDGVQYIPASAVLNALGYVEMSVGIGENIITYAESCVTYRLLGNGTMTIEGIGIIPNYTKTEVKPWDDFASCIKKIVIDDGVTTIGNYTFNNCENLTSVELSNTVFKINKYAFPNTASFSKINYKGTFNEWNLISNDENSNTKYVIITYSDGYVDYAPAEDFEAINGVIIEYLGSSPVIHIPEEINGTKITQIGERAFENTTDCYHITIPNTVTKIGYGAFWNCYNLRTINIPDSITELDGTFTDCSALNSVDLPTTITTIGEATFQHCTSLTSVSLPNVTTIGVAAFDNSGLTSFDVPNGVTSIPRSAFNECENLSEITMPQGLEDIGMFAFRGCSKLTSVDIPNNVKIIGDGAFNSCEYITEIVLPQLSFISDGVFYNCYRLQDIVIPKTVTKIYSGAFTNCYSLTNVYYKGSENEWQNVDVAEDNSSLIDATIHYNYMGTSECIVEFNTNGGNGYFSPLTVTEGTVVELPEEVFTREHYKFLGWALTSSATEAELLPLDKYTVDESIVFYAVWEPLPYIETTIDKYTNYSLGTTNIYNAPSSCILNIAAYYEGRLVSLESRPYTKSTETYAITEDYDTIKIMLWSGLSNLKPLCDANCISKAEQEFLALCNSTGDYFGIYNALNSDIYDYEYKDKVFSLSEDEKTELAKEMFNTRPYYMTIEQFEKSCAIAIKIVDKPVPRPGSGSSGSSSSGGSSSGGSSSGSSSSGSSSSGGSSSGGSSSGGSSSGSDSSGGSDAEPEDNTAVEAVITAIDAIGEVTVDSKEAIEAAMEAYKALTSTQQSKVTNIGTLTAAESALKKIETDMAMAQRVDELIDQIAEDKDLVATARARYDALTDVQKEYVTKYDVLVAAEEEISEDIYSDLEFLIDDMGFKMEDEIIILREEITEDGTPGYQLYNADEEPVKGGAILMMLLVASEEILPLRDEGFIISNKYVRETYAEQIQAMKNVLDDMTPEEKDAFKLELGKLNTGVILSLAKIFNVNMDY